MWIQASGQLTENVYQGTTPVSSHMLIRGEKTGLVDTGIGATHERLLEEFSAFFGEESPLDCVFLTHAHFDHVSGLPALRKRYPKLEVYASPQTSELLLKEENRELFYERNAACARALGVKPTLDYAEWKELLKADRLVRDGDTVSLGEGVSVKIISCPGHTSDSHAFYVLPDGVLACGESIGGYHGRDKRTTCFTESYQDYIRSLEKLSNLDVKVLGFPHTGCLRGELVPSYLTAQQKTAEDYYTLIKDRLTQGEVLEEVFESMLPDWKFENACPEGPFAVCVEETLLHMIRAVAADT